MFLVASEILATVNGKAITREDVDRFLAKTFPFAKYKSLNPRQKREVLNKLIDRELYLEMAKKEGIEKDPLFAKELEKLKENLMLDIWMKRSVEKIHVSEREAKDYYFSHLEKFYRPALAHARHILVSTREEAEEIIDKLRRSSNLEKKFIELAKSLSTGPSAKNGGDLGWFSKDQMLPEFSNATFALRRGEITHVPVKTIFGWHVIYLIDKKREGEVEFSKVKDNIIQTLKLQKFHNKLKKMSKELKKRAKISVK
jgi:parvulin-like peptidyl-prolyl isomerase